MIVKRRVPRRTGGIKRHRRATLAVLYIGVVLVPGIVLGALALRALDREEAYVEKTLANSLLSEVTQTVTLVQSEIDAIRVELSGALRVPESSAAFTRPPVAHDDGGLIDTVFLLSTNREILWPNDAVSLSEKEKEFLYWNAPLMLDRVKIPVVKNIVTEYSAQIIDSPVTTTERGRGAVATADEKQKKFAYSLADIETRPNTATEDASVRQDDLRAEGLTGNVRDGDSVANKDVSSGKPRAVPPAEEQAETGSAVTNQKSALSPQRALLEKEKTKREAADIFERNPPIREKIYKQAEEEGKELLTLNTETTLKGGVADKEKRSLFIVSHGTFSDIIAQDTEGFIPRFLGDTFSLLYWKKNARGDVIGCVVNMDAVTERILRVLPDTTTAARVFVVLDDKGVPLHAPEEKEIDWRLPFVAREIHEALPRWQAAAYLADPAFISSKAEATTSVLWVLTAFLLFAVAGGGVIMIKMLGSELALARKKTNLVTNVSHELKTPLTSIRLFAEMLMADIAPGPAKRKEYCSLLVSETERLSRLINNVLDFSKMSQGKKHYNMTPLDLVGLTRQVVGCEKLRLKQQGIRLGFTSRFKTLPFTGCRESLIQVLINLISNAEKYAAAGKVIDVSLEKKNGTIVLEVADRGPGVPAWAVKKIFQEFYRVDDSLTATTGGSGLGLTIARMIVADHDGDIAYLPRAGGGSVFRVVFQEKGEKHNGK